MYIHKLGEPRAQRAQREPARHRPARAHPIDSVFDALVSKEQQWRGWRMTERPKRVKPTETGLFFVIHLYAGRRRHGDFHDQINKIISSSRSPWSSAVHVLSIDTAIDERMNVHDECLWGFLIAAARAGRILAILLGPPCETWSSARHAVLFDSDGCQMRGPRPLRSAMSPWGLSQLSLAELKQLHIGNCLLLRGVWLSIPVALTGGAVILEHPAPPMQLDRAAIWRTGVINLLLREGWLFKRHTFRQGHHGACGSKPTSLLYVNCRIGDVLSEFAQPMKHDCIEPLIGHDSTGSFKTSKAKEYPPNLCMCFALAFWRRIESRHLAGEQGEIDFFAKELEHVSGCVDHTKSMMPDYQPMC